MKIYPRYRQANHRRHSEGQMNVPCISIERSTKRFAVFDGFSCVRTFMPYTDEALAIAEAKAWVAERTDIKPEITYPNVTRMTVSRRIK